MISIFPSIFIVLLVAFVALLLAGGRWSPPENAAKRHAAATVFAIAIAVQAAHFAEKAATGYPEKWAALFGIPAMPVSLFVTFHLVWIGIWVVSVFGVRAARGSAFFAAWFLAIVAILSLIVDPVSSILVGGYFPGLVSSPFVGIAGIWLALRLRAATQPKSKGALELNK